MSAVALPDAPAPIHDEIDLPRTKDGREVVGPMWVEFHPAYGPLPPALVLSGGWDGREFGWWDKYDLAEVPTDLPGRAFVLSRERYRQAADSEVPPSYEVFVGPSAGFDRCSCKGMLSARRNGHVCKHAAGVRWVVESGLLVPPAEVREPQGVA